MQAIREDYYFQMYYDNLPIWGFIGKLEKEVVSSSPGDSHLKHYLFTHVHFDIAYNGQRIVEINVSTDPAQVVSVTGAPYTAVTPRLSSLILHAPHLVPPHSKSPGHDM